MRVEEFARGEIAGEVKILYTHVSMVKKRKHALISGENNLDAYFGQGLDARLSEGSRFDGGNGEAQSHLPEGCLI